MQHFQNTKTYALRSVSRRLALLACVALTACTSVSVSTPQDQVRQRAGERWQALVAGEFSRAYTYATPSFRAAVGVDNYRNRFGSAVVWLGSEVVEVKCPEVTKCVAHVRIDYRPLMARKIVDKMAALTEETWLFEDGQWWIFQAI
jgi:hypothetical protein